MQDAIELAKLLEADGAFDAAGQSNLPPLRAAEAEMMSRKHEFVERKAWRTAAMRSRITEHGRGEGSLADWFSGWKLVLARMFLPRLGALTKAWYRSDQARLGRVGSDSSTRIYPNVREVIGRGLGK